MSEKTSIAFQILEGILSALSLFLFIGIIFPAILLALIPVQLYRWSLMLYVKMFKKDIVRIMKGKNPVLAIDDIHTRPLCTIVGYGAFEGANAEHMIQIARNCVDDTNPVTGELLHPETHQYYEEWMGYMWWKWEKNFKTENHVIIWEDGREATKPVLEKDFMKIIAILEAKPFTKGTSPWEAIIINNVLLKNVKNPEIPKVAIIFRFHHGLADGVTVLALFMKCVFSEAMDAIPKPAFAERNAIEKKLFQLGALLQLPYQFMKQGVCAMDVNDWHVPESKLSRNVYKAWTGRIPTSLIKEIKTQLGVGFTAVLISVVSGALRKMMIKHNAKVPKRMNALVPLPWPKHPQKFCNHWSFGFLELKTGESDPIRRLNKVHAYIEKMKQSAVPAVNFYMLAFVNMLPTWIIRNTVMTNYFPTVILSNFPGPPPECFSLGFPLMDTMFTGGPLRGNIGISICILSFDGAIRIVLGVDSTIFPSQEMADEFVEVLENEFYTLRQESTV